MAKKDVMNASERKIYNPCFRLIEWPAHLRKVRVKIERTGILKYIDVYYAGYYHQTLLCSPLSVSKGDELFLNMGAITKFDRQKSYIAQLHLPPVNNGPQYSNVDMDRWKGKTDGSDTPRTNRKHPRQKST